MGEMCFLKMVRIQLLGLSSGHHQMGTVNVKVCESDFVSLWDGTVMRRSLAERTLLEAYKGSIHGVKTFVSELHYCHLYVLAVSCAFIM